MAMTDVSSLLGRGGFGLSACGAGFNREAGIRA